MIIRPVELRDVENLRDGCYPWNTVDQVADMVNENIERAACGAGAQFVADLEGVIVGTVSLAVHEHGLRRHRAVVSGLVVSHRHTRRGVARRLIEACRAEAARLGCSILEISCRAGEPPEVIYPRLGFIEYGRLPRGLKETWGEGREFDEVLFYMPVPGPEARD